jgi:hypothetical protein
MINYPSVKIGSIKKITEALFLICKGVVLQVKAKKTDFISCHQNFSPHFKIEIANTSLTIVAKSKFLEITGTDENCVT